MDNISELAWYKESLSRFVKEYGDVPPPWIYAPNSHPYSLRWRMGEGETLLMVFNEWWTQFETESVRIAYFKKWPPPPRWIIWMTNAIWNLSPWDQDENIDYQDYFQLLSKYGFEGFENIETDMNDEQWLDVDE